MTKVRALVLREVDVPPEVEVLDLDGPGPGEVQVEIRASGVCRSDLHVLDGVLPLPLPIVLGHEASGVVTAVGPGVTEVTVGTAVVISWIAPCGQCFWCREGQTELCQWAQETSVRGVAGGRRTPFLSGNHPVYPFTQAGTLAESTVVPVSAVTPIPPGTPWAVAALLGCGVLTGIGAAWNAPVRPGDTVAVVGGGGVGLSILQGALLAGACFVAVVESVAWKRDLAWQMGAGYVMDPAEGQPLDALLTLTDGRGVDVAFDAVGGRDTLALAFNAARRGGKAVAVGVTAPHEEITLNAFAFPSGEKTLTGSWYGSAKPRRDIPRLLNLWRHGRLQLDPLVSHRDGMESAPGALDDLASGRVVRAVVWPQGQS